MKTCPSCRARLASNAATCPACGKQFTRPVALVLAILAGLFFLFTIIAGAQL